jgi:hypothetical protein
MNEKELFFEVDTRKHQQKVVEWMNVAVMELIERMVNHDLSKFSSSEKDFYIDPVYELNTQEVSYGSDRYKELIKQMGDGWKHHKQVNDHHPEHFGEKPFDQMNLFQLLEMCCDWIAASERRNNDPTLPLAHYEDEQDEQGMSKQLALILKHTINSMME